VEVLGALVEVCWASKAPPRQSVNRIAMLACKTDLDRKEAGGMKDMINTMPEWRRVHGKGL
jgi:hypothetical protein